MERKGREVEHQHMIREEAGGYCDSKSNSTSSSFKLPSLNEFNLTFKRLKLNSCFKDEKEPTKTLAFSFGLSNCLI